MLTHVLFQDVQEICKSIYTLLGNYTHEPITEEEEEIRSNQVFNKLSSGEELITCEDFQKACHKVGFIALHSSRAGG